MNSFNRHFVPAEQPKKGFPFSFSMEQVDDNIEIDTGNITEIDFVVREKADIQQTIKNHLMIIFDYYKYLDEDSEYNIVKYPEKGPEYYIKVNIYNEHRIPQGLTKTGRKRKDKIELIPVNDIIIRTFNFNSTYNYTLVKSTEHLKELLKDVKELTYDAETSGLDAEFDEIAGINFTTTPGKGYYIPINHDEQFAEYNLGEPALEIFYEAMLRADVVYMFNSRFDIRFMEYYKYDLDETGTNIINKKFDMREVNFIDTQISMYFADPAWKNHSLGWAEKHFLGYYRPDLQETLKAQKLKTFNTRLIDPTKILFYAAQDAISTLELGHATNKYIDEFGLSGQIDMQIIYPLMDMENRLIRIDVDYLNSEYEKISKRLSLIEKEIINSIGYDINLNSPQQKAQLFESFGLDTGVKTKSGNMSTSREAVEDMIDRLEAQGKEYPQWLKYLGEQTKLQRLESTFFGNLLDQVDYRNGRVRFNYRHGVTSTGRFSSGKES